MSVSFVSSSCEFIKPSRCWTFLWAFFNWNSKSFTFDSFSNKCFERSSPSVRRRQISFDIYAWKREGRHQKVFGRYEGRERIVICFSDGHGFGHWPFTLRNYSCQGPLNSIGPCSMLSYLRQLEPVAFMSESGIVPHWRQILYSSGWITTGISSEWSKSKNLDLKWDLNPRPLDC